MRLTQIKRLLVRHTRKKEVDLLTMVQWFNIGAVSFLHFHPLRRVSSLMIVVVTMIALHMKTPDDYKGHTQRTHTYFLMLNFVHCVLYPIHVSLVTGTTRRSTAQPPTTTNSPSCTPSFLLLRFVEA